MVGQDTLDYYRGWLGYRRWFLRVPGVQVCVAQDGQRRLSAALGYADEPARTPLTERHLFRIASHSKTFTAVLALRLVEQGRLRLDDPVAAHVPGLVGSALAQITLRELLSHGGGVIRDSEDGDFWQLTRPYPDREELTRLAAEPSAAVLPRHERFKYSNIAYGVLGLVIEQVTGAAFDEAIQQQILDPLGLSDTGPELTAERREEFAAGHSALSYAPERAVIDHVDTAALGPATGFFSTATELASFYSALLPDEDRLLSHDSSRQLRHRQWDVKEAESGYGLGVFLNRVGEHELFGHSGGYPGHITRTLACPKRRTVVSVLTNAIDGPAEPLAMALFRLMDLAESASHQPAPDGARFTGRFSTLWGVQDVALLGGRLFGINPLIANPAEDPVALEVLDDSTLKMVSGPGGGSIGELARYEFEPDGSIRSVRGGSGMTMRPFEPPAS
ncbi:MAG TPA: serine hydrolase domain-containing protein [Jatrophihabitans sp.]|jgi:CubicO group peptidase (beta-lactamase class C family)|uniref:serine hydrolase domain-containing protein n=1 Tax=Jatrophihabitans sp. TaxID=1932789 RepID=UPI002EF76DAC